ncbi:hypothetical protein [Neptuniibacter sp.]|uniref:hypothetical protein n=1 Tax=Neptuniibacter sp. TaxID=1962643 RepID=UPI0026321EF0|nr:hypothetical protein [Neptuniibacter sp.]MCP4597033.1 hypothetical protein [Neptuniibacter sp.]
MTMLEYNIADHFPPVSFDDVTVEQWSYLYGSLYGDRLYRARRIERMARRIEEENNDANRD